METTDVGNLGCVASEVSFPSCLDNHDLETVRRMIFGGCFGSRGFLTREQMETAVELLRDHHLEVEMDKREDASVCWIQSSAESKAGVLVVHSADAAGEQSGNVLVLCKTPFLRVPFLSPKLSEAEKVLQSVLGVFRLHGFVAGPA